MRHSNLYKKLIQSKQWRELRVEILREQPLCEWCKAKGYVVAAREVHHLIEAETGRTEQEVRNLMFQRGNLVALCHDCHANYHKSQRYHSKEKHLERQAQRMEQWKDAMEKRFNKIKP